MENVYSLLDRKMVEYGQLMLARNDEAIKRACLDGIRGSGSLAERYPEDFDVFCVGQFDRETGALVCQPPRLLGSVHTILGLPSAYVAPAVREASNG